MDKLKNYALAAIGVIAVALSITLVTTKRAGAQQAEAIARPPAKPASPVEVVNVPTVVVGNTPLAVFDIDNARQPFQTFDGFTLTPNGPNGKFDQLLITVPNGKRLVIEQI